MPDGSILSSGATIGLLACAVAGLANGSFAVPMKRIATWDWEHVWLAFSLIAYGLLPLTLAIAFAPGLAGRTFDGASHILLAVLLCGALWGAGSVLFGISLTRLGVGAGSGVVSSVVVLAGSLGPVLLGTEALTGDGVTALIAGLAPLVAGIACFAIASVQRDAASAGSTAEAPAASPAAPPVAHTATSADAHANAVTPRPAWSRGRAAAIGLLVAIAAGLLSAMLNIAFVVGQPLIDAAAQAGYGPHVASLAVWLPSLAAGLLVNLAYTGWRVHTGAGWARFHAAPGARGHWLRCALMAALWFGAILAYGYGAWWLGPAARMYGWALIVGGSMLTSNLWGIATGEWRAAGRRPRLFVFAATTLLVASVILLARQGSGH